MDDLLKPIDKLPIIYKYIFPGYIYLLIHSFICSKKNSDYKYLIFKSVSISFLFYIITTAVENIIGAKFHTNAFSFIETIIAILFSYCFSRFYYTIHFTEILNRLGIQKTVSTNIWQDIHKYNQVIVKVYLKDEKISYYGSLSLVEEKDENNYLGIAILSAGITMIMRSFHLLKIKKEQLQ